MDKQSGLTDSKKLFLAKVHEKEEQKANGSGSVFIHEYFS